MRAPRSGAPAVRRKEDPGRRTTMTNRFQVAAIAAVVMLVGSAAPAQQNVC
jgi:hypothetical protein